MGRFLGCDDLDAFGWDQVAEVTRRDGVLAFPMIPANRFDDLAAFARRHGLRADAWDAFVGDRDGIITACAPILAAPLPEGFRRAAVPADPASPLIGAMQALTERAGVAPYPADMLSGLREPCITALVIDDRGRPAATGFAHRPHAAGNPFHTFGFVGGVAVDASARGLGLGRLANAILVHGAVTVLECSHVEEFVSPDNAPSRAMVEACGLRHDPSYLGAMLTAGERVTR